ncbi:DedA family protein [Bacillus pinisoli]|uniref:DedA family protein n=1 Tax=Bacillus pinisoli TaxID=2901866 RepID=UPI001FF52545|nr:DedA family protein [Bacillus pinisoli]
MELETAFHFVDQYGYIALFVVLWIGIFIIPVPNEIIVMSTGLVLSNGMMTFLPTFFTTYFGVVMSLSTLYVLGRFGFYPLQKRFLHRTNYKKYVEWSSRLIEKYGPFALVIGYCFPGVRHFVPFVIGSNRMKFRTFALYAYSTAAVWSSLFFMLGFFFGEQMDHIVKNIFVYGSIVTGCIVAVATLFIIKQSQRRKRFRMGKIS